ncbi:hypothetical protein ANN_28074, partial [Periplaneta americana]
NHTWFLVKSCYGGSCYIYKGGKVFHKKSSKRFCVPFSTLQRRTSASEDSPVLTVGRKPVLSLDVERALATRLIYLSKRGFGLTPKTVRKYAYQYVSTREIQHNFNIQNEMAGEDWFQGFLRRNPELSLRKSEGRPECLYNQDETGLPMNNKPPNVVAQKGSRDVVSLTNVERGENVTVMACVSATGAYIPPFVIFKGKRMRAEFSDNMPAGTEVCMTESGWVNEEAFGKWLKHFNKHRTPGKKKQSVNIICDSSEEHEETEEQKDEDETESVCNFNKMSYNDDRSSHAGDWIQCQKCKLWYHERCVNAFGRKQFVCGICM